MNGISMHRLLKSCALAVAIFGLSVIGPATRPAQAFPVVCLNCSSWITQLLEYAKQVLEYATQLEQYGTQLNAYRTQIQQYRNMLENSVNLDRYFFDDALVTVRNVEGLLRQGRNVSFAWRDLDRRFRERYTSFGDTYRRYNAQFPTVEVDSYLRWSEQSGQTMDMALNALRAAKRQSEDMDFEQRAMDQIADQLSGASGHMDVMQTVGELTHHSAQQMMKLRQLAMVQVEVASSTAANEQRRLDEDAAQLRAWTAKQPARPRPRPNSSASYYRAGTPRSRD